MSDPQTTKPVYDESGLELNRHTVKVGIKWLMWQYGMTIEEANTVMAGPPDGNTRQRRRQEAIDIADFVEHAVGLST